MSDFFTELGYYKGDPVIKLQKKHNRPSIVIIGQKRQIPAFLISMDQLHYWSEDHNKTFEEHLYRVGRQIFHLFELGEPNVRELAQIAELIQSRIDDLIKMPPLVSERKTVGEAIVTAAGETFEHEITKKVDDGYKQYRN